MKLPVNGVLHGNAVPQKGVHIIVGNNNVDIASEGMGNDFTPLCNLFNECMIKDTSKKN